MENQKFEEIFDRVATITTSRSPRVLAAALNISEQAVYKALRAKKIPSTWFYKLTKKFTVLPDWLLYGKGPMRLPDFTAQPAPWVEGAREGNTLHRETGASHRVLLATDSLAARVSELEAKLMVLEVENKQLTKNLQQSQNEVIGAYRMLVKNMSTQEDGALPELQADTPLEEKL